VTAVAVGDGATTVTAPGFRAFKQSLDAAAAADKTVTLTLLRDGKQVIEKDLVPVAVARGSYGLGIVPSFDEQATVIAEVTDGTPAAAAKLPARGMVTSVDGKPVANWREVHLRLREAVAGKDQGATVKVGYKFESGEAKEADLTLAAKDVDAINQVRYEHGLLLAETKGVRRADGIGQAVSFGAIETRDFILQFYLTLKRMVTRDVSPTNLMGPVGIFQAGTHFASKGGDWLLWFLAMISANLAVVNFLPIPVVDGGLFVFLVAEKIKGKPISERTQAVAQYVGLALLLSIFLFVTYQDIANFAFRMR
jgi:regulator of sigma E protease